MTCHERGGLLVDKFYGELGGAELAELERHLAGCMACRREEATLRQFLGGLPVLAEVPVPDTRAGGLVRGARPERVGGSGWLREIRQWLHRPIPAYQVVAGFLLVFAGWWMGVRSLGPPPAGPGFFPRPGFAVMRGEEGGLESW